MRVRPDVDLGDLQGVGQVAAHVARPAVGAQPLHDRVVPPLAGAAVEGVGETDGVRAAQGGDRAEPGVGGVAVHDGGPPGQLLRGRAHGRLVHL
ncbi:hypothetical protein ADL05_02960 [Nocardiopsis sp. NRRL B-16309]|nr:hypothetical protein ADL05_02960 [Nocardiopsis sp. NRRL B-16309]